MARRKRLSEHGEGVGVRRLTGGCARVLSGVFSNLRFRTPTPTPQLHRAHSRAKLCPLRNPDHRGETFTVTQRNKWLGYQWQAMESTGMAEAVKQKLLIMFAGYALPLLIHVEGPYFEA